MFALVLALVEMVAFGVLGWMWWLVAHAALAVVLFAAALAWRRKGKGGLLDRLLSARGGTGRRPGGSGAGIGRKSGGLFGRLRGGTPTGGIGGSRGLPWRKGKRAGSPGRASTAGTSGRVGKSLLPWRKNRASRTGNSGGGSGLTKRPTSSPQAGKANAHGRKDSAPQPAGKGEPKATATDGQKATKATPADTKTTDPTTGGTPETTRQGTPAGSDTGGKHSMTNPSEMQYSADQSLQRAGANLAGAESAAAEIQRLYAQAEAAKAKFNEIFGRATDQMENDLPSSSRLKAEMETTKVQAQQAASADEWRAVAAQAATLPVTYRREHEVDEERLAGGRGGRHREKRADVTAAEQDN